MPEVTNNVEEIVFGAGGVTYVAPVGTPLPTNYDEALNAAFVDIGHVSDAGVAPVYTPTWKHFYAWNPITPIISRITQVEFALPFAILGWNRDSLELAFNGGTWTEGDPDEWTFEPPTAGNIVEKSVVIKVEDGDNKVGYVVERCVQIDPIAVTLKRDEMAALPVNLYALANENGLPFELLLSGEQFAPAGS